MSVLIGAARISENGTITGKAGDQTGKEVQLQSWYEYGWDIVIRAKSAAVAEKMAKFVEGCCQNDKVGYDQYERNSLRAAARDAGWDAEAITTPCETDCAALMAVAAEAAGVDVTALYTQGNAPVTSWMRQMYRDTGAFDILDGSKYLTSDNYLLRGDILVREDAHTVMALEDGAYSGGETHSGGDAEPEDDEPMYAVTLMRPIIRYGAKGQWTRTMQTLLWMLDYELGDAGVDGVFGNDTDSAVRSFQFDNGLEVDGEWGPQCWTTAYNGLEPM